LADKQDFFRESQLPQKEKTVESNKGKSNNYISQLEDHLKKLKLQSLSKCSELDEKNNQFGNSN